MTFISADDVRDLRTKLDEALTALGVQTSSYDDQTLAGAPNGTIIKKVHITQLRLRATSGTGGAGGSSPNQFGVQWLVPDQLGTPRMVFDETGSLSNVKRHDYLPFGEDLVAGSRATTPGYGAADGVRQKFTGYERDGETNLDFAQARYVSNAQGRFTSPDPFIPSIDPWQPQSMNRYSYVINNPLNLTDSLGLYFVGGGTAETNQEDPKQQEPVVPDDAYTEVIVININWDHNKPGVPSIFDAQGGVAPIGTGASSETTTPSNPANGPAKSSAGGPGGGGFGWGFTGGGHVFAGIGVAGGGATGGGFFGQFGNGQRLVSGGGFQGGALAYILAGANAVTPRAIVSAPEIEPDESAVVVGASAGGGAGLFFTNAAGPEELRGPFDTRQLNTPWIGLQYDTSGGVRVFSFTLGPTYGASYFHGKTSTLTTPSLPTAPLGGTIVRP